MDNYYGRYAAVIQMIVYPTLVLIPESSLEMYYQLFTLTTYQLLYVHGQLIHMDPLQTLLVFIPIFKMVLLSKLYTTIISRVHLPSSIVLQTIVKNLVSLISIWLYHFVLSSPLSPSITSSPTFSTTSLRVHLTQHLYWTTLDTFYSTIDFIGLHYLSTLFNPTSVNFDYILSQVNHEWIRFHHIL